MTSPLSHHGELRHVFFSDAVSSPRCFVPRHFAFAKIATNTLFSFMQSSSPPALEDFGRPVFCASAMFHVQNTSRQAVTHTGARRGRLTVGAPEADLSAPASVNSSVPTSDVLIARLNESMTKFVANAFSNRFLLILSIRCCSPSCTTTIFTTKQFYIIEIHFEI